MDAKWKWLINYLLKSDFDTTSNAVYDVLSGKGEDMQKLCTELFSFLHPRHRDALMEYYIQDELRTPILAQNLYHGRMALWAVLHWPGNSVELDALGELCCERITET